MKQLLFATAIAVSVSGMAQADAWPEVGDQFRTDDGTLLVVSKIKVRPNVSESLVCMYRSGTRAQDRSCTWVKELESRL